MLTHVPGCCVPESEYRRFFRTGIARRDARRFRKRGLDKVSRRLADAVVPLGVDGARVLEGGGGIGAIQIELLEAGAAEATNVELSDAYEGEAESLLRERGLVGRVERRGLTLVPTRIYFKGPYAKVELALARGDGRTRPGPRPAGPPPRRRSHRVWPPAGRASRGSEPARV